MLCQVESSTDSHNSFSLHPYPMFFHQVALSLSRQNKGQCLLLFNLNRFVIPLTDDAEAVLSYFHTKTL